MQSKSVRKPAEQIKQQLQAENKHPDRGFNPHPLFVQLVGSHHHDRKKCKGGRNNQGMLGVLPDNQHADAIAEEDQHRGIDRYRTKVVKQLFALFELTSNRLLKVHQRQ